VVHTGGQRHRPPRLAKPARGGGGVARAVANVGRRVVEELEEGAEDPWVAGICGGEAAFQARWRALPVRGEAGRRLIWQERLRHAASKHGTGLIVEVRRHGLGRSVRRGGRRQTAGSGANVEYGRSKG
jgi:hypothetical protein